MPNIYEHTHDEECEDDCVAVPVERGMAVTFPVGNPRQELPPANVSVTFIYTSRGRDFSNKIAEVVESCMDVDSAEWKLDDHRAYFRGTTALTLAQFSAAVYGDVTLRELVKHVEYKRPRTTLRQFIDG